jgi:hypothetical protein
MLTVGALTGVCSRGATRGEPIKSIDKHPPGYFLPSRASSAVQLSVASTGKQSRDRDDRYKTMPSSHDRKLVFKQLNSRPADLSTLSIFYPTCITQWVSNLPVFRGSYSLAYLNILDAQPKTLLSRGLSLDNRINLIIGVLTIVVGILSTILAWAMWRLTDDRRRRLHSRSMHLSTFHFC